MSQASWGPHGKDWFSSNLDARQNPLEIVKTPSLTQQVWGWGPKHLHFPWAPR